MYQPWLLRQTDVLVRLTAGDIFYSPHSARNSVDADKLFNRGAREQATSHGSAFAWWTRFLCSNKIVLAAAAARAANGATRRVNAARGFARNCFRGACFDIYESWHVEASVWVKGTRWIFGIPWTGQSSYFLFMPRIIFIKESGKFLRQSRANIVISKAFANFETKTVFDSELISNAVLGNLFCATVLLATTFQERLS